MRWAALAVLLVVAVICADRVLLAAERHGWIYYRHRQAESGSASAAAFGAAFDVLQPSRQVVAEERRHQRLLRHDQGNARDPADSPPGAGGADCPGFSDRDAAS